MSLLKRHGMQIKTPVFRHPDGSECKLRNILTFMEFHSARLNRAPQQLSHLPHPGRFLEGRTRLDTAFCWFFLQTVVALCVSYICGKRIGLHRKEGAV